MSRHQEHRLLRQINRGRNAGLSLLGMLLDGPRCPTWFCRGRPSSGYGPRSCSWCRPPAGVGCARGSCTEVVCGVIGSHATVAAGRRSLTADSAEKPISPKPRPARYRAYAKFGGTRSEIFAQLRPREGNSIALCTLRSRQPGRDGFSTASANTPPRTNRCVAALGGEAVRQPTGDQSTLAPSPLTLTGA
jgi:hypothetical protein